jgi:hypothetical protein
MVVVLMFTYFCCSIFLLNWCCFATNFNSKILQQKCHFFNLKSVEDYYKGFGSRLRC